MEPTIRVKDVSKWYGNVVAVSGVSFEVGPGITGLLGPNGAGKTTLLHMMAGLARPSEGQITLMDRPLRGSPDLYRRLGVMTEHDALYEFYTGRQFVELSARLSGVDAVDEAVGRAIEQVGLEDAQDRRVGGYSRGMRQRIRLAAALVHSPDVMLLDEPLSGADPRQRVEIQGLLQKFAAEGKTLVVSSHILEEVEVIADSILLVISGKLAAAGEYRAIRARLDERPYRVLIGCALPRVMASGLVKMDDVESVSLDGDGSLVVLTRNIAGLRRSVPALARDMGVRLYRMEPLDDSLESVFSYLVEA